MHRCPICDRPAAPRRDKAQDGPGFPASAERQGNPTFPFCSPRCKLVDLGKWLSEDYRVSVADTSNEGDADDAP